jgi:hypothetical protein
MARSLFAFVLVSLLSSGCSLIVEDTLQNKAPQDGGNGDSGPTGATCAITADCLRGAEAFDCTQVCVGAMPGHPGRCSGGMQTPDGTVCGMSGGTRICVGGTCVAEECGDGYVNRTKDNPEYCDLGDRNGPTAACHPDCTRNCGSGFPNCTDGNTCNGMETCSASGTCQAQRLDAVEGTACVVGDQTGTCSMGSCVPD